MSITSKKENVVTDYHGTKVKDPYRWLEDMQSPEVQQWTDEQNNRTQQYLGNISYREKVKKEITEWTNFEKVTVPEKIGDYYYFHQNDGLQNQPVLSRSTSLDLENPEVIVDPNSLHEEGAAAITSMAFSKDHGYLAYAISYNGSDWQEIKIKDLETKKDFPEVINWCRFTNIAWNKESSGFYYSRYPDPNTVPENEASYHNQVYFHQLGTAQEEDQLVYEDRDRKELAFSPIVVEDYLILKATDGTEPKSRIYYRSLNSDDSFIPLISDGEDNYDFIANDGETFYMHTNYQAPKGKIIAIDINNPEKENWKDVVPENDDTISFIRYIDQKFIIVYLHHAYHIVKTFDKNGSFLKTIDLPTFVSVTDIKGNQKGEDILISYHSFLHPDQIVQYNYQNDRLDSIVDPEDYAKSNQFETKQIFYSSKDGTKIPMYITYKKGIELNGDNPLLLFGYGGYNISMTPSFSPANMMWMDNGGIYAVANLRGGSEYGEEWHLAGTLEKKQNVFDDFISAAEWLIEHKYTNPKKLSIMGRSNGGLLVGACINQRPDLFGAALCMVPVTDALRFHLFTAGRFWINEFGNAEENKEHFDFMYKYSPLHNVNPNAEYPPTLITTGDHDDRVVPLHATKFAAALQEHDPKNPILLRVDKNAGHGLGKPTEKWIEEQTDLFTFLFKELNVSI
ncbi:prolyl oligopeptidase family serine peptidase [Oceanobacillus halotolerans]|uniref:prolyl oligopeptidase family serine peptidase n=1 Tax=Oceanobacillus halotolerans TaxID=2663380 RepID=UPI0013DB1B72|nr:prolyl oligopeptidase family serine peptidase [Oceanobacillus halotolerans]